MILVNPRITEEWWIRERGFAKRFVGENFFSNSNGKFSLVLDRRNEE